MGPLLPLLLLPAYKEWLRLIRLRAYLQDFLCIRVEDTFLPPSAWANHRSF